MNRQQLSYQIGVLSLDIAELAGRARKSRWRLIRAFYWWRINRLAERRIKLMMERDERWPPRDAMLH
jgi:hypothetical protein